jgi:chromosome segregation ATPase
MSTDDSPSTQPGGRPPRTILEVLCREVGAAHPDGALKQIRTMKRLLRSHYHNQKRLQRWGIDGLSEAVEHVKALQGEVRSLRNAQRKRAAANVAALDEALSVIETARHRLRKRAAEPAPPSGNGQAEHAPTNGQAAHGSGTNGSSPYGSRAHGTDAQATVDVDAVLDVIGEVESELDEMRLELWALSGDEAEDDAGGEPGPGTEAEPGARAESHLQHLAERLQDVAQENAALRAERDRLDAERTSLLERLQAQQARIARLETQLQAA